LHYLPFLSNTFAQAVSGFGRGFGRESGDRFTTKVDGSFRLLGLPGRAIVGAFIPGNTYMHGSGSEAIAWMNPREQFETIYNPTRPGKQWPTVMEEINPPADAKNVHVNLQAKAGVSIRYRLVNADGKPVPDSDSGSPAASESVISQLRPDEELTLLFRRPTLKLGKVIRVRPKDHADDPVIVKLEPLATIVGRVAGADGAPVSGATIKTRTQPVGELRPHLDDVASDEDGRFTLRDVPIGCGYQITVYALRSNGSIRLTSVENVFVKPGETTDVGEVRFGKN
jgi:hypothetical protein